MIGGAQGLCFAVSSNTAIYVLGEFLAHGRVRRAFMGVEAQTIAIPRRISLAARIGPTAVRVGEVVNGGPADQAGLRSGDIIPEIDQELLAGTDDFLRKLNAEKIGRQVTLRVLRAGSLKDFAIVPQDRRCAAA
jgi:S1-C subfamily serine protease